MFWHVFVFRKYAQLDLVKTLNRHKIILLRHFCLVLRRAERDTRHASLSLLQCHEQTLQFYCFIVQWNSLSSFSPFFVAPRSLASVLLHSVGCTSRREPFEGKFCSERGILSATSCCFLSFSMPKWNFNGTTVFVLVYLHTWNWFEEPKMKPECGHRRRFDSHAEWSVQIDLIIVRPWNRIIIDFEFFFAQKSSAEIMSFNMQ